MMHAPWLPLAVGIALVTVSAPGLADHLPDRLQVEDRTVEEPVKPLGEPRQLVLDVTVPCQENETAVAWTRARLVEAPAFVRLGSEDVTDLTGSACHDADDTLTVALPIELGFDRRAPAFETTTATVEVRVQKNHTDGNVTHLGPAIVNLTATPGYLNLYNVRLEKKIGQAGPQESIAYPIVIENYSNGPTRFQFALSHPDNVPDGFQPVVPEPLILESTTTGGTKTNATVTFSVFTPFHNGYVNENGAIQLRIDSFYAENTTYQGESSHVSTLTQARGLYVPGPGLLVLVALCAGGVLAARSRT